MGAAMEATIVATMGAAMAIVAAMGATYIMVMPTVVPTGGLRAAMDAGKGLPAATSGERARVAFHTTLQPSDGQQRADRPQLGARGKSSTARARASRANRPTLIARLSMAMCATKPRCFPALSCTTSTSEPLVHSRS